MSEQMGDMTAGPKREITPEQRAAKQDKATAQLWTAVWEASQYFTTEEIREYVNGTLHEIDSDQP